MPTSRSAAARRTILGIDPGFADLGYGVIEIVGGTTHYRTCGNCVSPRTAPLHERLLSIEDAVIDLISTHTPDIVAVEKLFFATNLKTAIDVAQARGVILAAIARAHLPIIEFTPLQVKQALTSYGAAPKSQVGRMVNVLLGNPPDLLNKKDDAIDALAIALCAVPHMNRL